MKRNIRWIGPMIVVALSSDAGHNAQQNPFFGLDPQARLDYGYQAVGKLTPMARHSRTTVA